MVRCVDHSIFCCSVDAVEVNSSQLEQSEQIRYLVVVCDNDRAVLAMTSVRQKGDIFSGRLKSRDVDEVQRRNFGGTSGVASVDDRFRIAGILNDSGSRDHARKCG